MEKVRPGRLRLKLIAVLACLVFVGILATLFLRASPRPVELKLLRVVPPLMVQLNGEAQSIVELRLSNRCSVALLFQDSRKLIEARGAEGWAEVGQSSGIDSLRAGEKKDFQVLAPGNCDTCRVTVYYDPPTLRSRLFVHLPAVVQQQIANYPRLRQWFWRQYPPRWQPVTWEVPLTGRASSLRSVALLRHKHFDEALEPLRLSGR